jgi:multicomponent K+:H+ antiporter subunit G
MNEAAELPAWTLMIVAILLITGAATTLIGSLGLLRLRTFYERVHAPTLGTTFGTACIVIASVIYFSATGTRPVLNEFLILIFVTVTTPVTLMILIRASVLRDRSGNKQVASEQKRG